MTLTAVPGIRVGHARVPDGGSGCSVVLGPFRGAVEVRGMATGTRELDVLSPEHLVERVNALLLTGGSAFGLDAAAGVMAWLADRGEGFATGVMPVPVVPGAVIFDLAPGVGRPGPAEGRAACERATSEPVAEGRVGVGAGATVGKLLGPEGSSPGGVGSASRAWEAGMVGALAVVNALGDVVAEDGSVLAGVRGAEGEALSSEEILLEGGVHKGPPAGGPSLEPLGGVNTTLTVVATDLPLSRNDLRRVARVASGAFPRAIKPANTPFDGDVLFALSTAEEMEESSPGRLLSLGVVARALVEEAIRRAVTARPSDTAPCDDGP